MKKKFIMIITTIVVCLVFVVTMSYAWFTESNTKKTTIDGSTPTAYYKSGDGTESNPYVIARPVHLYNFAWLQYMGTYNKLDSDGNLIPTYFKIESDETDDNGNAILDMSGTNYSILPPIGTEDNPFVGNFDGNNTIIKGLTTSSNDFKLKPASVKEYTEPHILGFFGYVGEASTTITGYDSSINTISNLYIDDYTVKNTSNSPDVLVGLLAGYANAQISNSGVLTAQFDLVSGSTKYSSYDKISKYSLIGDYNESNFNWAGKPSGGSGDVGYGTSTDIKALHLSLIENELNDGDTGKIKSRYVLPFKYESDTLIKGSGDSITVTTSGSRTQPIKPSDYYTYKASTKGNNLGYYIGEVKTYEISLDYSVDDFGVQSQSGNNVNRNLKTPPDDVLSYLKQNGTHLIRLNNGYSSDNITTSTFSYVQNGQVGNWTGNLILPSNGIWVAPKENGTFKFVFYNANYGKSGNAGSVGILFIELKRETPGDYSSPFVANTLIGSGLSYSCKYGYFEKTAYAGYEYYITFYNSSSYDAPYIAYMDIGTNGGDSGDEPDEGKSPIDFAYFNSSNVLVPIQTKTTDNDGNVTYSNNSSYVYSNAFFEVDGTSTGTLKVQFKRTLSSGTTETITLTYYFTPSIGITTTPNKDGVATSSSEEIISGS